MHKEIAISNNYLSILIVIAGFYYAWQVGKIKFKYNGYYNQINIIRGMEH